MISVEARRQSRLLLMDIDARFELSLTSDTGPTPSIFSLAWKMRQDYASALIQCKKSAEDADIEGLTPQTYKEITDWFEKYFFPIHWICSFIELSLLLGFLLLSSQALCIMRSSSRTTFSLRNFSRVTGCPLRAVHLVQHLLARSSQRQVVNVPSAC